MSAPDRTRRPRPRRPSDPGVRTRRATRRPAAPTRPRTGHPGRSSETLYRILWALPWAAFAITIVATGGGVFAASVVVVAAICLGEFFRMARAAHPYPGVAMLATAGLVAAAYWGDHYQMMIVLTASIPALFLFVFLRGTVEGVTRSVAVTVLGIVWIGLPIAHAVLLRELPDHGAGLLVDVLVATIAADTAAYGGGRAFGRHAFPSAISPNKTIEGFLFGVVGGTLGFWFAGLYQDWLPGLEALAMGAVIAVVAPLGDLFESAVKRDLGVKDSGTAAGPHGGLLDRLDAILFTVVAGYYLSVAFLY